jgi:hyperosmotically inducible protein
MAGKNTAVFGTHPTAEQPERAVAVSQSSTAASTGTADNADDRTITQRIRKNLVTDKSLSTYAHKVKIVSINGTVTLSGVVRSEDEKSAVEVKAVWVVGPEHVVNDLTVAPKS